MMLACEQPFGYVADNTDCNDSDYDINPDATEVCNNGEDDDCDGTTDENEEDLIGCTTYYLDVDDDTYGVTADSRCLCGPVGDYTATQGGDCNDAVAAVNPAATEICDGIDNDCDGNIDGDICDCDINGDSLVSFADVIVLRNLIGTPYDGGNPIHVKADRDGDGDIDVDDYKDWLDNCYIQY